MLYLLRYVRKTCTKLCKHLREMENEIKNRIPIHAGLAPNRDAVHSRICLKPNDNVFIFIILNKETKGFEGYFINRNYEIEKYRGLGK